MRDRKAAEELVERIFDEEAREAAVYLLRHLHKDKGWPLAGLAELLGDSPEEVAGWIDGSLSPLFFAVDDIFDMARREGLDIVGILRERD